LKRAYKLNKKAAQIVTMDSILGLSELRQFVEKEKEKPVRAIQSKPIRNKKGTATARKFLFEKEGRCSLQEIPL